MSKAKSQETIKIYLRIRPAANPSSNYAFDREFDKTTVKFHLDKNAEHETINNSLEDFSFQFDDAFDREVTQEHIFTTVAKPCVDNVLKGYNSTLFAYGQTGSGKTFSITGGTETYEQRGIIPRALDTIFSYAQSTDRDVNIRISYLQIYNDKGQDLLNKGNDAKTIEDLPRVTVSESDDEFVVRDLGLHACYKREDALNLLLLGDTNRIYCETSMNSTSSRSHCIFTIAVEQKEPGSAVVTRSKLHFVDLAGSERVKKTGADGKLLKEARYINLSLHYLQKVITALCEKAEGKREHIPYRESMMTMILRDSLGGNCKTVMLATAHPQDAFMDETISTCKFSQRVASIKVDARINEETDPVLLLKKFRAENAALRDELAMLRNGDQAGDRLLSSDEEAKCESQVQRYLTSDDDTNMTGVEGDMARIFYCFRYLKALIKKGGRMPSFSKEAAEGERPGSGSRGSEEGGGGSGGGGGGNYSVEPAKVAQLRNQLAQKDNEITMLLSIVQKYQTPKSQACTQTGEDSVQAPVQEVQQQQHNTAIPPTSATRQDQVKMAAIQHKLSSDYNLDILDVQGTDMFKDTAKAFETFRKSWRKFEQIEKQKNEQAQRCDNARALAEKINQFSKQIAHIKNSIQQLRAERATQGWEDPDQQETELFAQLDKHKTVYRKHVAELAEEKKVYEHFQGVLKGVSVKLSQDFESWWTLRRWQMTGGRMDRSESIKAFSELQFQATARNNRIPGAPEQPQPPKAREPEPTVHTPAAPSTSHTDTQPSNNIVHSAAPDADVQSELQKLFKAREQLRSSMQA